MHIRDIASSDSEMQKKDVEEILAQLLSEESLNHHVLEVHNKIDLLPPNAQCPMPNPPLGISALTGEGVENLLRHADEKLQQLLGFKRQRITLQAYEGKRIAWLHEHANVLSQKLDEEEITLEIAITAEDWERFNRL